MDMWDPYIAATRAFVPDADEKIVFDRYHATTYVTKAVDKVRREEHRYLAERGDFRLKKYQLMGHEIDIGEHKMVLVGPNIIEETFRPDNLDFTCKRTVHDFTE